MSVFLRNHRPAMGCVSHTHGAVNKKITFFCLPFKRQFQMEIVKNFSEIYFLCIFCNMIIKLMTMSAFLCGKDCGLEKFTGANQNSFSLNFSQRVQPRELHLKF